MAKTGKVDIRVREMIIKRHEQDQPAAGLPFEEWCGNVGKELNVSPTAVRTAIIEASLDFRNAMDSERMTLAQKVFYRIGANELHLAEKLMESLNATQEVLVQFEEVEIHEGENAQGKFRQPIKVRNPRKDENGDWIVHKQPNYNARVNAIKLFIDVLGAKVPEQQTLNIMSEQKVTLTTLDERELHEHLAAITGKLAELQCLPATAGAQTPDSGGTPRTRVRKGLPAVVDVWNEDSGRAGSDGEPVQAVPESTLYSTPHRRLRK